MDLSYSFLVRKMGSLLLFWVDLDKIYLRHLAWLVPVFGTDWQMIP